MFLRVFKYFKGKCYINFDIRCAASILEARLGPLLLLQALCRERDSNPHNHSWSRDFKSLVSTIPPSRQP